MSKRRLVPAGLRSELEQYSSLLRALRTDSARNVTAQLARPPSHFFTALDDDDDNLSDVDLSDLDQPSSSLPVLNEAPVAGPSDLSHPSNAQPSAPLSGQKRKRDNKSRKKETTRTGRDLWTRWPLPVADVETPEFTLEEELVTLAKESLKRHPHPPIPNIDYQSVARNVSHGMPFISSIDSHSDEDVDDGDEFDLEDSSFSHHLTGIISALLSSIFGLLSMHTQPTSSSTHARIQPMDWKSIMDILSIFGDETTINAKTFETTLQRLEALYGPYDNSNSDISTSSKPQASKPLLRMNARLKSTDKLRASFAELDASLFSFLPRPPQIEEIKTKRNKKQATDESFEPQPAPKQKQKRKKRTLKTDDLEEKDQMSIPAYWNAGVDKLPARQSRRKKVKTDSSLPEVERRDFDPAIVDMTDEQELHTLPLENLRMLVAFHGLDPKGRRSTTKGLIQLLVEKGIQENLDTQGFDAAEIDITNESGLVELGSIKLRQLCLFHGIDPKRRFTVKFLVPLLLEKARQDELAHRRREHEEDKEKEDGDDDDDEEEEEEEEQ